jgi:hypothetical protein
MPAPSVSCFVRLEVYSVCTHSIVGLNERIIDSYHMDGAMLYPVFTV